MALGSSTTLAPSAGRRTRFSGSLARVLTATVVLVLSLAASFASHRVGVTTLVPAVLGLVVATWLFAIARPAIGVATVLVYVMLIDGFIRLRTGHQSLTLIRDVLLYALAIGLLARSAVRRETHRLPPL